MKTVLVVDDVPEVTTLLKARIERTQRYMVVSANGGKEALRLVGEVRPDLVVCDIDMPGMDGSDLSAAMAQREATRDIPFIFLSSLVTPQDVSEGAQAGRWPMMSKQAPIEGLLKAIDDMLRG